MSARAKLRRRTRYKRDFSNGRCQKCDQPAILCTLPCFPDDPPEHLCPTHAAKAGYCRECGQFCAGTDGFDFHHPGFCDVCHDQLKADFYEPEEEDDEEPWDPEVRNEISA